MLMKNILGDGYKILIYSYLRILIPAVAPT